MSVGVGIDIGYNSGCFSLAFHLSALVLNYSWFERIYYIPMERHWDRIGLAHYFPLEIRKDSAPGVS